VTRNHWNVAGRFAAVIVAVVVIVVVYRRLFFVNPTTVSLTLLMAVLAVAAAWGLRYAVFMAVLAALSFNFFFLPPFGTFTIAEAQNWVAFGAFLITAVVASQLSERARRQALDANRRRREAERLYSLSQQLLSTESAAELVNAIPRWIVETFGIQEAALLLQATGEVYRSNADVRKLDMEDLQDTLARGEPCFRPDQGLIFMPVRLGMRTVGAYGIVGSLLRETLESVGSLVAVAVERARAVENLSRTEAARESEKLRSALLDAITHELRTPLTGIKASVGSLLSGMPLGEAQQRELLTVIDEETDRLNRLVGEATEMAQFDAQGVQLELKPHTMAEVAEQALENTRQVLAQHPVEMKVPVDLPSLSLDLPRMTEVLVHLLENAAKYSPADTPIQVMCEVAGNNIVTSVSDQGPGIDAFEQSMIFDKFYRGRDQRHLAPGTGMGLSIAKAIVESHGGTISVTSQLGHGSVFSVSLPLRRR
jgi:two-component system sensor histidine kinase KdpD